MTTRATVRSVNFEFFAISDTFSIFRRSWSKKTSCVRKSGNRGPLGVVDLACG